MKGNIWQISGSHGREQTTSGSWLLTLPAAIWKAEKEIHLQHAGGVVEGVPVPMSFAVCRHLSRAVTVRGAADVGVARCRFVWEFVCSV